MPVDERKWSADHPAPQVTLDRDRLSLWNYPVGRAELQPTHEFALRQFLRYELLASQLTATELSVRGFASASGEGVFDNLGLSQRRAETVGSYLKGLGFRSVDVSAAGSAEPSDRSPSGQAYARNRRVEVSKFWPAPPQPEPDVDMLAGAAPAAPAPTSTTRPTSGQSVGSFLGIDFKISSKKEFTIGGLASAILSFDINVRGRLLPPDGDPGGVVRIIDTRSGKIGYRFESALKDEVRRRFTVEDPAKAGDLPVLKYSQQWQVPFRPEVGVQSKPQMFFGSVTLEDYALPEFKFQGFKVVLSVTGQVKLELGPTQRLLDRLAKWVLTSAEAAQASETAGVTGGAAATFAGAAALGGVAAMVATVMVGLPMMVAETKEASLGYVDAVATRDGAASKVARAVLGPDAQRDYEDRQNASLGNWKQAFKRGADLVTDQLRTVAPSSRPAMIGAWATTYAKASKDFRVVQAAVFLRLGGYDRDAPDPATAIGQL